MSKAQNRIKAFVSCSLRPEDEREVSYVCGILEFFNLQPFGTVGKFSASPENPLALMKKNIKEADIVVICATPRYVQQDIGTGKESKGLSEMIQFESGMAFAIGKPVVVFAWEGTHLGSTLPNITQYITLNGSDGEVKRKHKVIESLLNNARQKVAENKRKEWMRTGGQILGFIGALAVADSLLGGQSDPRD